MCLSEQFQCKFGVRLGGAAPGLAEERRERDTFDPGRELLGRLHYIPGEPRRHLPDGPPRRQAGKEAPPLGHLPTIPSLVDHNTVHPLRRYALHSEVYTRYSSRPEPSRRTSNGYLKRRNVAGLGMGIVFMVLPLYLGEVAGPRIRASLGYVFPGIWYAGSLFEYVISPYVGYQTIAWITLVPPIVFFSTFLWFPESPYYLLMKGKEEKAGKSLAWLRGQDTVEGVKEELDAIRKSIAEEAGSNWRDLIRSEVGRKSLVIVTLVAGTYIMCGGTAMFSYSTDTFTKIGGGVMTPDQYTILMCSVLLVVVPLSGVAVDRMGRRPILLLSAVGSALCLGCTSLFLYLASYTSLDLTSANWVPHFSIILYTVLIGAGVESIVPVLQAELFANTTRGSASCISFFFVAIMSCLCLKMYQVIGDGLGLYFLYGLFALFAALGALYIYFFVPETKGKTFAEIQEMLTEKSNPTPTDP